MSGKAFALLVADRLAVNREACLSMIAQRVEKSVRIGGDGPAVEHDGITQARAGGRNGQSVEGLGVNVVVGIRDVLQEIGAGRFYRYHRRHPLERQLDIKTDGNGAANGNVLLVKSETLRASLQVVRVGWDIGEPESAGTIGSDGLLVIRNAIYNRNLCVGDRRARRVCHRAVNGAGVTERLRWNTVDRTERKQAKAQKSEKSPHGANHTEGFRLPLSYSHRRALYRV